MKCEIALPCPHSCLPPPPWAAARVCCLFLMQAGLALEFIPLSVSLGDFIYYFCPFSGGILLKGLLLHWSLQYNQYMLFIFCRD